ncbi:myocardial zonula adherens protein [Anolis carolinensis]|uniref:myocardial zonula adherens protein n=1 Tax=Anolis carolinensis TaxID=28377 RepID=UPI002F2B830B
MQRYSSGLSLATLTTTKPRKPPDGEAGGGTAKKTSVCRLRLTLPPEEGSPSQDDKNKAEKAKKQLCHAPNGLCAGNVLHGVVYGVVRRSDDNHNKEMVVYGWSPHQLREEMQYIRDVRLTLEKVRKKMYGEYDDMKRKIKELTNELAASGAQQGSLENSLQVHSAALDSFSEMNSSLTSASIELQRTLVDVTLENTLIRDQIKSLKQTHEESMERLKEKQKQLETARVENELLKLKVECSQEANADVMREMTRRLYSQYEERLQEEEKKHQLEKETLIAETNRLLTAIEDANRRMKLSETSLREKDQRIGELDRFIQRMEEERHHLQKQLTEYELQLHGASLPRQTRRQRSHELEEAASSLQERIRHLDDMVLCQQKKVKHMVEEIELQKRKMKQKELFIVQLLEKISFLEGENKELQDRLDYLMETQSRPDVETRDVAVGSDLPVRKFISRLPDKGKKISDFAERLRAAIAGEEERERTAGLLKAVRSEFRKQHEATGATKADINAIHDHSRRKDVEDIGREAQPRAWTPEGSPGSTSGLSEGTVGVSGLPQGKEKALERPETCRTLSDAFERLSVAGGKRPEAGSNASPFRNFPNVPPKTPHYIEVLEERAKNPVATRRSRFKTNALPAESSGSSHGSPGVSSPGGGLSSSLSAEERRRRDRQHLDDVTAARLPPLHHQPSQLIPIEDSIAIQILQKEQYEETQAKLAAQRLGVKMGRYEPEGEAAAVYREARDEEEEEEEEGYSSTED